MLSARRARAAIAGLLAAVLLGAAAGLWAVQRLGGWRYLAHRLFTLEPWPTYTQRASQLDLLSLRDADLVLLGDSHVAAGEWHEWLPGARVANRGIPGDDVPGLRRRLPGLGLSPKHTAVVQVGTNDLLFRDPADVFDDYTALYRELSDLGLRRVALTTLPGVNNGVRRTRIEAADVAALNDSLRAYAEAPGGPTLLELAGALGTAAGVLPAALTDDGVHLRGAGYAAWAEQLRQSGLLDAERPAGLPQTE